MLLAHDNMENPMTNKPGCGVLGGVSITSKVSPGVNLNMLYT